MTFSCQAFADKFFKSVPGINMFYTALSPRRLLLGGFISIIIGSYLLKLPIASATGNSLSFLDALFTAASAVSTTGMIVVDVGNFYSLFGQVGTWYPSVTEREIDLAGIADQSVV